MAEDRNNATGTIVPTLFIGLGGTGKEVLLRLRRKFYEKLRKPGLPCTSFLWIDTDTGDNDATGVELDGIFKSVQFTDPEKIPLLTGQVGRTMSDVFRNPGNWPQIHDWLYPEVERYGTEISDGAGGVRAVGRLTFFKRFAEKEGLDNRVRAALDHLSSRESIQATQNVFADMSLGSADFTTEKKVQVVLICSVAGGTGSGTMLDMAFYLKHLAQKSYNISPISGIVFLPNVYYANAGGETAQRSFGNAYAALKELEFFTLRQGDDGNEIGKDFKVQWEKGNSEDVPGPPFNAVYLQEMWNEAGVTLKPENRSELFTSVAESLFLDFMPGAFSTQKRSQYSNVVGELSTDKGIKVESKGVPLPQDFARRYASFGISKIEVPMDAILGACSTELASEILSYVLRENDNADVRRDVADELAAESMDEAGIQNQFGPAWKDAIQNEVGALYRSRSVAKLQDINELESLFPTLETKLVRSDTTEAGKMGIAIGLLRENTTRVLGKADKWLTGWVQASLDNNSRGLRSQIKPNGYLPYAKSSVEQLYKAPQAGEKARFDALKDVAAEDADYYKQRWNTHLQELRACQSNVGVAALGVRGWTNKHLLKILEESHEQYLKARAALCLYDECKKVALALATRIDQLKTKLEKFQPVLEGLQSDLHEQSEQFLHLGTKLLFIQVFDREKNWKDFYRLGLTDIGERQEVQPAKECETFLHQSVDSKATLLDLIDSFQGKAALEKLLTDYCETRFRQDFNKNPRDVNVLESSLFKDERTTRQTITNFVQNASPMMRVNPDLAGTALTTERRAYLGIRNLEDREWKEFADKITAQLGTAGYTMVSRQSTGLSSEVYLYLVNYAFPLSALDVVVNECHSAYSKFYQGLREGTTKDRKSQIQLHLSKKWEGRFPELVAYTEDKARKVKEAREILLFGTMLRVLTVKDAKQPEYGYILGFPFNRIVWLGFKWEAIDRLNAQADTRQMLQQVISNRKTELTPEQLLAWFWAVQYMINDSQSDVDEPEKKLLDQELESITRQLVKQKLLTEEIKKATELGADNCKVCAGDTLDWSGAIPVLKNIEQWKKVDSATTE